ncbi:hypothetical protein K9M79_08075 [Candidatus Woesearchaeota archaeon]|nr:hypothetical protein [Candidatus Woesearchaeota archaeon]
MTSNMVRGNMAFSRTELNLQNRIRSIVHKSALLPVVFYPGSDVDILEPLMMTGFSKMICVDNFVNTQDVRLRIEEELSRTTHQIQPIDEHRFRLYLDIHGSIREVDFHCNKDINKFNFNEISSFDVYYSNGFSEYSPSTRHQIFSKLRNLGFFVTNSEKPSLKGGHEEHLHRILESDQFNIYLKLSDMPKSFFYKDFFSAKLSRII